MRARQLAPAIHAAGLASALALAPIWPPALLYPFVYVSILALASFVFAARSRDAAGLLCGLALGIMHLAWGTGFWRAWLRP